MNEIPLTLLLAHRQVEDAYRNISGFDKWYDNMSREERERFERGLHLSARAVLKDYHVVAICSLIDLRVEEP